MLQVSRGVFGKDHEDLAPAELAKVVHDRRMRRANSVWYDNAAQVLDLSLETIEIDLSNAYCPSGCCRMSKYAVRAISELARYMDQYAPVTAIGLVPREQEGHLYKIPGSICSECVGPRDEPDDLSCVKGSQFVDRRAR